MWSQLIKLASITKGALVVGVAASAALVSNAEFSNTPSQHEPTGATPIVAVTPAASSRPANSPSTRVEPKKSDVPTAQLPASTTPSSSPSTASGLQHGEVPGVIKECVEKYLALRELGDSATNGERESTEAVCKAALALSGLSGADFWAKFGPGTHPTTPKTEPSQSTDLSTDALHWVRECVTKYTLKATDATAACKKAIELTGLTSAEFAAKYLPRTTETKPTATPTRPATAEFEQLVYTCRKLQGALTDASPAEQISAAAATCSKAIAQSGLGTTAFWVRWPAIKPVTSPTSTPKPVTSTNVTQLVAKCLQMYADFKASGGDSQAVSEACGAAIRASGLSSTDFWAKYHPNPTT